MSFKFNFQIDESSEEIQLPSQQDGGDQLEDIKIEERPACLIEIDPINVQPAIESVEFSSNVRLFKLARPLTSSSSTTTSEEEAALSNLISSHRSDLIPGVYEGGFKLWECSIDLVNYMIETSMQLRDKRVLEIGCGHALPALYCLQRGAYSTFQDYNHEVLRTLTIPNYIVNTSNSQQQEQQQHHQPRFISGDWKHVNQLLKDEKFDAILASDTLYSIQSFRKQIDLVKDHLAHDGICLMAAKSFYFGVGGSVFQFKQMVTSEQPQQLQLEVVKSINDGTSNMREITGLRLSSSSASSK